MANCDHVAASMPPSAHTRCIADAGFFLDTPNVLTNHSVMRDRFFDVVDGMNSTAQLPSGCKTDPNLLDARLCFFSQHALKHTSTPTLILNSVNNFMTWEILTYDPWAPGFPPGPDGWGSCLARQGEATPESWAHCTRAQRAVIDGFRDTFLVSEFMLNFLFLVVKCLTELAATRAFSTL